MADGQRIGAIMAEWFEEFHEGLWLRGDEGARQEAAFLKRALGLRKGRTILDAPCGDGRLSLPLAEAGLLVAGIDRNPYFIRRALERFAEKDLKGEFFVADLREIGLVECFHAAINWGGSFGYFSDEENLEILRRLARAVRPGGRVLVDQPNREYILRHFEKDRRRGRVSIHNRWDRRHERIVGQWTLRRRGAEHTFATSIRLYTLAQMKALFKKVGLKVEKAYGSAAGDRFGRASRRLILVGRKGKA